MSYYMYIICRYSSSMRSLSNRFIHITNYRYIGTCYPGTFIIVGRVPSFVNDARVYIEIFVTVLA